MTHLGSGHLLPRVLHQVAEASLEPHILVIWLGQITHQLISCVYSLRSLFWELLSAVGCSQHACTLRLLHHC